MEIANALVVITLFATLVEFLVNVVKDAIPALVLKFLTPKLLALTIGILLAITFQLDIFAILGFTAQNIWVPMVATGLIISAGSVPVHELIAKLRESRAQL